MINLSPVRRPRAQVQSTSARNCYWTPRPQYQSQSLLSSSTIVITGLGEFFKDRIWQRMSSIVPERKKTSEIEWDAENSNCESVEVMIQLFMTTNGCPYNFRLHEMRANDKTNQQRQPNKLTVNPNSCVSIPCVLPIVVVTSLGTYRELLQRASGAICRDFVRRLPPE